MSSESTTVVSTISAAVWPTELAANEAANFQTNSITNCQTFVSSIKSSKYCAILTTSMSTHLTAISATISQSNFTSFSLANTTTCKISIIFAVKSAVCIPFTSTYKIADTPTESSADGSPITNSFQKAKLSTDATAGR